MQEVAAARTVTRDSLVDGVDIGDLGESIGFLTRMAQLHAFEDFFEHLGGEGLRPGEYSTLLVIDRNPHIRQGVLAQALRIKPAHMTKLIRGFETRGLLTRRIPDHDRRSVELVLTEEGREFVRTHRPAFADHENRLPSQLTARETQQLKRLLRKFAGLPEEDQ